MTVRLTEAQKIKVLNGADLYAIMQQVLLREKKIDRGKEHIWVVALAENNRIMMIELVGLGTPRRAVVEPVDVFSFALQKQAAKVILVHNHPSGELKPSTGDLAVTQQMLAVGKLVQCEVIDHLIISEKTFYSFQESGLLDQLATSAPDLTFKQVKEAQAELDRARLEAAQQEQEFKGQLQDAERKIQYTAIKLLQEGFDPAKVASLTGLSEAEVVALAAGR